MHPQRPAYTAWLLLFLPLLAAIGLLFHPVLRHPDTTFLGTGDDALKNYYTPWYHARHDSSWHWFGGMNYPYGDHIVFADAQPLLSNGIRAINQVAPGFADHTVGIMNLLMLGQILLAGFCLWRILLRLRIEPHFAAGAAAAITLLSPQLLRMSGHFALSYACLLPLLWLLLLRAQERPGVLREGLVGLCLFLAAWLQPYYLMIGASFLALLQGLPWAARIDRRAWHLQLRAFALQVLLPGLAFAILLGLTDPVADRPANPTGMADYIASWRTVFLPIASSYIGPHMQPLLSPGDQSWEGVAYIGLSGGIAFLLLVPAALTRLVRHRRRGWRKALYRSLPSRNLGVSLLVIAALLLLVFAMGFPFAIKPERMAALFPPIKQFRSLGRFAWLFYELWMVYLAYALYRLHRHWRGKRPWLAYGLPALAFASLFLEGMGQLDSVRMRMPQSPPAMSAGQTLPWLDSLQAQDYSAIVSLPWFHAGGENLYTTGMTHSDTAFAASLRTGLPLLNVMMSRTSTGQTWDQFQLATEPARPLALRRHLHDHRPLLAIRHRWRDSMDGDYFRYGIPDGYAGKGPILYALDLHAAEKALLQPALLLPADSAAQPARFRFSFDQDGDAPGMYGTRGKTLLRKDNYRPFDGTFPDAPPATTYTVSLWAQIRPDGLALTYFGLEVHDAQGQNLLWSYPTLNNFVTRIEGDWALCEREVTLADPSHRLTVNITRWSRVPPTLVIDELSIRRSYETELHTTPDGILLRNNRPAQKP